MAHLESFLGILGTLGVFSREGVFSRDSRHTWSVFDARQFFLPSVFKHSCAISLCFRILPSLIITGIQTVNLFLIVIFVSNVEQATQDTFTTFSSNNPCALSLTQILGRTLLYPNPGENTALPKSWGEHCFTQILGRTLLYPNPGENTALPKFWGEHCFTQILGRTLLYPNPGENTAGIS